MPSASFGSNQVDFGGMILPASATAIRSGHLRRVEGEGDRHLAGVDPPLELVQAAAAADEVDALVGALVGDAEERLDRRARVRSVIGRRPTGSFAGTSSGRSVSRYQLAVEVHAEFAGRAGRTGSADGVDREALAERGEERLRACGRSGPEHAVVVEDGHLVVGKEHRRGSSACDLAVAARARATRAAAAER